MKTYVPAAFSQVPLLGGVRGGFLHGVCRIVTCWTLVSSVILCVSHAQVSELTVDNFTVKQTATIEGLLEVKKGATISEPIGLAHHYRLDENFQDAVGANHGTLDAGGTVDFVQGKIGLAHHFNGGTRIALANTNTYIGDATFSVWVKLDMTASVVIGSPGSKQYTLLINDPSSVYVGAAGVDAQVSWSINPLAFGVWHHFTVVKQGSSLRLYLNGAEKGSRTQSTMAPTSYIGYGQTSFMYGALDDLRIYNRALSASEVLDLSRIGEPVGAGLARFYEGIEYMKNLGDLSMGTFTNQP